MQDGIEHHVSTVHGFLANPRTAQHQSASLTGFAPFHRLILGVDRPDARFKASGTDRNLAANANRTRKHGASDRRAMAGQGEAPVHRETEFAFAVWLGRSLGRRIDPGGEDIETGPCDR